MRRSRCSCGEDALFSGRPRAAAPRRRSGPSRRACATWGRSRSSGSRATSSSPSARRTQRSHVAESMAGFDGIYVDANAVSPRRRVEIASASRREAGSSWTVGSSASAAGRRADAPLPLGLHGSCRRGALSRHRRPGAGRLRRARLGVGGEDGVRRVVQGRGCAAARNPCAGSRRRRRGDPVEEWQESIPDLPERSDRAVLSAGRKGWRWVGEMDEIASTFAAAGLPDGFHKAAAEIYRRFPKLSSRPGAVEDARPAPAATASSGWKTTASSSSTSGAFPMKRSSWSAGARPKWRRRSGRSPSAARRRSASPPRTATRSRPSTAMTSTRPIACCGRRGRLPSTSRGRSTGCARIRHPSAQGRSTRTKWSAAGAWPSTRSTLLRPGMRALTHCNTGALATGGYGTALGAIRLGWERGLVEHVWVTETRPLNQGSRLTAWELEQPRHPVLGDRRQRGRVAHGGRSGGHRPHRRRPHRGERGHRQQDRDVRSGGARAPSRRPIRRRRADVDRSMPRRSTAMRSRSRSACCRRGQRRAFRRSIRRSTSRRPSSSTRS